jgi:pimeloyl-ACP methyl ester carboxylesterase
VGAALALAVIAGLLVYALRQRQASSPTPGTFQTATCPFQLADGVVEGHDVRCGYLTVLEDHARPHGRTIQLAVAIFTPILVSPAPDPIIYLGGGPGGPVLASIGPTIQLGDVNTYWGNRAVILLDQRGLGYSQPSLACFTEAAAMPKATGMQQLEACRNRLVREGIDLNDYNTIQNADDVHDLIHALGYHQANLQSVSYGTRLALTVMRLFPTDVRSVLLDSTAPPQTDMDTGYPAATQRAFDTLFQGCAANATCNQQYPHLQAVFAQLVSSLNQHPATVQASDPQTGKQTTAVITGDNLVDGLRSALYVTSLIPKLPAVIYQVAHHDYSQAFGMAAQTTAPYTSDSVGMKVSVDCSEMKLTSQAIPGAVQMVEPETQRYYVSNLQEDLATCQLWNVQPAPASQWQPVTSAIPTLIYAGEYDPTTPPAYGMLVARTLSRSYFFHFPGAGHAVWAANACSITIYESFLANPHQRPDATCLSSVGEPAFV